MDTWTGEGEGGSSVIFVKQSLLCEANGISALVFPLVSLPITYALWSVLIVFCLNVEREKDLCPSGSEELRGRGPSWEATWHGSRECSGPGASTEGLLVGLGQTEGGDSCHGWPLPPGSPLMEDVSFFVGYSGFASSVVICSCGRHEQERQWGVRLERHWLCSSAAFFFFSFGCTGSLLL